MKPHRFSETALGATVIRALHLEFGDPIIFADPYAGALVPEADRDRVLAHMLELVPSGDKRTALAMEGHEERAAFVLRSLPFTATSLVTYRTAEERLEAALEQGISQCVILGAGLDSTAQRLAESWPSARVFEVDHPATQALKQDLVRRLGPTSEGGPTFVPVDFEKDDLGDTLLAAGLDRERPVFVSWLNVTVYLSQDAVLKALAAISALSAPASELVFDFCGEEIGTLRDERVDEGVARMVRTAEALGEPMTAGLSPDWVRETLSRLGYADIRILRPEDLADLRAAAERNGYRFMPACYIATAAKP